MSTEEIFEILQSPQNHSHLTGDDIDKLKKAFIAQIMMDEDRLIM